MGIMAAIDLRVTFTKIYNKRKLRNFQCINVVKLKPVTWIFRHAEFKSGFNSGIAQLLHGVLSTCLPKLMTTFLESTKVLGKTR